MAKGSGTSELPDDMCARLDRLVDAPGRPGKLARIRLAAEVSYLFERAPKWTKAKILPLFEWSCADAVDAWSSRKYSNYIGSPELFGLLKRPFLEMFERTDVPLEDLRTFADWLTLILMANKGGNSYPLAPSEARSAVRRAGVEVLSSVGHRLAIEMEAAKQGEKRELWRTVIAPVFQEIWPLDVELQSRASTFKLVQILRATGEAFHEAADVIIPFIRPDDSHYQTSIFSIAEAPEALYASSPTKMLELVSAVVGDAPPGSVYGLGKALSRISAIEPGLANTRKFQRLLGYASA
jgi:hypothetical protein